MNSALYVGSIRHQRFIPKKHGFRYPFFMWFLNLDEVDRLPDFSRWFSPRRWSLSRFQRSDYFGSSDQSLADAVRSKMAEKTGKDVEGAVCGLMNLRTLGLYFSPVNFYYGFDSKGNCTHFLAEVSNIPWNERHIYCHYIGTGDNTPHHRKEFHVSPFNSTDQTYTWKIGAPADTTHISLNVDDNRGHIFEAHLELSRHPLTHSEVRKQLLKNPAMTMYIVVSIYWQALKLFIKGVPYVPYKKETS